MGRAAWSTTRATVEIEALNAVEMSFGGRRTRRRPSRQMDAADFSGGGTETVAGGGGGGSLEKSADGLSARVGIRQANVDVEWQVSWETFHVHGAAAAKLQQSTCETEHGLRQARTGN